MLFDDVTRLEVIDYTKCKTCKGEKFIDNGNGLFECTVCGGLGTPGRTCIFWDKDKQIQLSLQDDNRTLKIFVTNRG